MAEKAPFRYGGQAVIEGVMMRGRKAAVTAVRRPNGELTLSVQPLAGIYNGWMRRTPFLRGIIVLIEAMVLGIKSLFYSASIALEEEEEELSGKSMWLMAGLALLLAVGLFFVAPLFLTRLANPLIPSSLVFHVIEGVIRLAFFVGYLWAISLLPDIKRVFTYHGAEHMTINALEADVPMEVGAIRKYGTAHVRCGTSFIFIVLVIAIIVFGIIGRQSVTVMLLSRILLIPVIAGVSYEITYFSARHTHHPLVRAILAPGLWLQSLTTGKPDDRQLEVAVVALQRAMEIDREEEVPAAAGA
ncbi:MAG: DUF1385 domain-containing protein [Chloroflexota bacterium]